MLKIYNTEYYRDDAYGELIPPDVDEYARSVKARVLTSLEDEDDGKIAVRALIVYDVGPEGILVLHDSAEDSLAGSYTMTKLYRELIRIAELLGMAITLPVSAVSDDSREILFYKELGFELDTEVSRAVRFKLGDAETETAKCARAIKSESDSQVKSLSELPQEFVKRTFRTYKEKTGMTFPNMPELSSCIVSISKANGHVDGTVRSYIMLSAVDGGLNIDYINVSRRNPTDLVKLAAYSLSRAVSKLGRDTVVTAQCVGEDSLKILKKLVPTLAETGAVYKLLYKTVKEAD